MKKDIIEQLIAEVEKLKGEDLYLALKGQNARLLAVARAAKDCYDAGLIRSVPWTMGTRDGPYPRGELLEALAAVEDLLDG